MIQQDALAPIGKRIAGGFVDLAITFIAAAFALFIWGFLEGTIGAYTPEENWKGRGSLVGILIDCALTCYFMTRDEQATLGQRMLGIKTIKENGEKLEIGTALGRYLVSIPSSIFLKIGYLIAVARDDKKTMHDLAAGTIVVITEYQNTTHNFIDENKSKDKVKPANEKINESQTSGFSKPDSQNITNANLNDDDLWTLALEEFESKSRIKGLYAKLYTQNDGNEQLIKSQYLKERYEQLRQELLEIKAKEKALAQKIKRQGTTLEKRLNQRIVYTKKVNDIEVTVFENGKVAIKINEEKYGLYVNLNLAESAISYSNIKGGAAGFIEWIELNKK